MKTISCYLSVGLIVLICLDGICQGAITATATRGEFPTDLDGMISNSDLIQGLIATELPGDNGWHEVNPATLDPNHPWGLKAFTDGVGTQGIYYGLLNDFPNPPLGVEDFGDPNEEDPTKVIQYDLGGTYDIDQINFLTGNQNNSDGRIFSSFVVRVSTNNGASFCPVGGLVPNFPDPNADPNAPLSVTPNNNGYYQSDPSGFINSETGLPGTTEDAANLVQIFDDGAAPIALGVTNIQFWVYSVDNSEGENRDPFDGVNPFTGVDDGLTAAIRSPLVWEIDVLGEAGLPVDADFDQDGFVDGDDFLIWQSNVGLGGQTDNSNGDANGDGIVGSGDLEIWECQYGYPSVSALSGLTSVPEPTSVLLAASFTFFVMLGRRRSF